MKVGYIPNRITMRVCYTNPTLFLVKRPLIESVVVEVLFRREVVEEWMEGENIVVRPVRGGGNTCGEINR
jgi:hypothetical protein